jgi:hypothetical protein
MRSGDGDRVLDPGVDAAAFKALTHPLRNRLLGLLRQDGPATASELAVVTGETTASTSYHLRVLAKYSFIAEAEGRDKRERRWKAVHATTSWDGAAMTTPGSRAALSELRRRQLEHLNTSVVQHEADIATGRLPETWHEPSGMGDWMLRLSPKSLGELWRVLEQTLEDLARADEQDPHAKQVVVLFAGLPLASRTRARDAGNARTATSETGGKSQ